MTGMLILDSWEIDEDFTKNNINHEQAHEIKRANQGEVPHACGTEHFPNMRTHPCSGNVSCSFTSTDVEVRMA